MKNNFNLTIVVYHYVRDAEETSFPKINAVSLDLFNKQLKLLKSRYDIVSINDIRDALEGKTSLPANSCVLSFDDGLKDHYENVFPLLKEHHLTGVFFPATMILEGRVADVNKIQFLLAKLGIDFLVSEFNGFIKNAPQFSDKNEFVVRGDKRLAERYRFSDPLAANFKILFHRLPADLKKEFLDKIFSRHIGEEKKFAGELYLSAGEIKKMSACGMVIGGHTHTHQRLNQLSAEEQREELSRSKQILENITEKKIDIISYPSGGYNDETVNMLPDLGYKLGLSIDPGINNGGNFNRWALKRIDANEV